MKLEDKDIDQLFKSKLGDLNISYNPSDWNKLSAQLQKKKIRKGFWLFLIAIMLIAVGGLTLFTITGGFYENNSLLTDSSNERTTKGNHPERELKTNAIKGKKDDANLSTHISDDSLSMYINDSIYDSINNEPKTQNTLPGLRLNNNNNNNNNNNTNTKNKPSTNENLSASDNIDSTNVNEPLNVVTSNFLTEPMKESKPSVTSAEPLLSSNKRKITDSLFVLSPKEIYTFPYKDSLHLDTVMLNPGHDTTIRKGAWGIDITSGISSVRKKGDNESLEVLTPRTKIGFSLNYFKPISQHFDLITGFEFEQLKYAIQSQGIIKARAVDNSLIYTEAPILNSESYSIVSAKLGLNIFVQRQKIIYYGHLLYKLNVLSSYNTKLSTTRDMEYEKLHSSVRNNTGVINSTFTLGMGIDYSFSQDLSIYSQVEYQQFLFPKSTTLLTKLTPYSFDLRIGIKKNIFKTITPPPLLNKYSSNR